MKHRFCSLLGLLDVFNRRSGRTQSSTLPEGIRRAFSLAEIQAATNNFNPDLKIGEEGFGAVYRGTVDDGTIFVAVKVLRHDSVFQGIQEFRKEIVLLCQLRHPNIVSLIGFCHEQNKIILVYEYMSRGSLDHHLFGGKDRVPLAWNQRLHICIGAARGLHYLHAGAKRAVIHRDIMSSNILLDDDWSCKLSDFGLSKIGPLSMSKASIKRMESRIVGTLYYMAPEYMTTGELTDKSDVYSFGKVLFEVICGRRVFSRELPVNQQDIVEWALELGKEGKIYQVVDPCLRGKIASECFHKYLEIARSCVHPEANERPAMGEVEVALELALELQMKADSEIDGECMYEEASYCTYFDLSNYNYPNQYRYSSESENDDIDSS